MNGIAQAGQVIHTETKGNIADWCLFLAWLLIAAVYSALSLPLILLYMIYVVAKRPVVSH